MACQLYCKLFVNDISYHRDKIIKLGVYFDMNIMIAQWRKEYETGDVLIDEQHKSLFSIINSLYGVMLEGQGESLLEKTLETLKDYTDIHFQTEEEFMINHNYPHWEEHHKKHEILREKVWNFDYDNDGMELSQKTIKLSHFLMDWLINHIKNEDKKMIDYCCHNQVISPSSPNHSTSKVKNKGIKIAHWQPEYETGFTLVDDQHKTLFYAINALNSAMLTGKGADLLEKTLRILGNYTTIHFETEEQYMLKYNYPAYLEHHEKHQMLRKKVAEFSEQRDNTNPTQLTIKLSRFLTNWLIEHIKGDDRKMINFLRQKRLETATNNNS